MARASKDFETFNANAQVGGNLPSTPFDEGGSAKMAAAVFANLGATLGKLADKAVVKQRTLEGVAVGEDGVPLPETYIERKVEKGGELPADTIVRGAVKKTGRGGDYYDRLAQIESGGNPNARNKDTGAAGLYQFMPGTARQYQLDNPYDPAQAKAAVRRFTADNKVAMHKVLGRAATDGELYLAHQQGAGGAAKLLLNGNALAVDVVGQKAVLLNGGTANMTAQQFANLWINKFGGGKAGGAAELPTAIDSGVPSIAPEASPEIVTEQIRFRIPDVKPLALRRDGTLGGDAYDAAVLETANWRMGARVDAAFNDIYAQHKDNPAEYDKAMKEAADGILEDAAAMGPEIKQAMAQRIVQRSMADIQKINSVREEKANNERKTAATAALDAQDLLFERQAYVLGTTQNGDGQLAELARTALGSIDAAVASGAITGDEGRRRRENTLQSMTVSRIKGVFDAKESPEEKQHFADGLMTEYLDLTKNSPLQLIKLSTMESLVGGMGQEAKRLGKEARAVSAFDKARFERLAADDVASLGATGAGVAPGGQPLDFAMVEKTLGSDAAYDWLAKREVAQLTHAATAGLEKMTAAQIAEQLDEAEPKAGEDGFAAKQQAHEVALKQAALILKQRAEDPAASAEAAFPAIADEKDPVAKAQLRMDGQAALGIAAANQLPLTSFEADGLARRIAMVENNPELLNSEMESLMTEVQGSYGTMADEVMGQVLMQRGLHKETAILGAGLMLKLNIGQMPENSMLKAYGAMRGVDQAADAMDGKPVVQNKDIAEQFRNGGGMGNMGPGKNAKLAGRAKVPNTAQVNLLRQNPELAPQFDASFGEGASAPFLKDRNAPIRRKLPDGSVELTYDDGWMEVLRPDGTVEGRSSP
jgi:Transglycosylase SLT domain